jgi:hypothetical protein
VIGFLVSGSADSFAIFVDAFKHGMRDNGLVEDRDYVLDLRFCGRRLWPLSDVGCGNGAAQARRDYRDDH